MLGSRLNIRQISYNWNSFARFATEIQVDVDQAELRKPLHKPDIPIHCDVKVFLGEMARQLGASSPPIQDTKHGFNGRVNGKRNIPWFSSPESSRASIEPLRFHRQAFRIAWAGGCSGMRQRDGMHCPVSGCQAEERAETDIKFGLSFDGIRPPRGYRGSPRQEGRTICIAGDGSLQMNVQELQTLVGYNCR